MDDLIVRLEARDGRAWMTRAASVRPLNRLLTPSLQLREGISSEEVELAKNEAKQLSLSAASSDDRLRGTLGYFIALITGKLYFGRWPSSQPADQIASEVGELATTFPMELQERAARAAMPVGG